MPIRPHPGRGTRSFRSESGSILILTALSIILLLGIAAFAVDGSFMYTERNRMHAAADAAAKSGAWELYRGSGANLQAYANREVMLHGFTPSPAGNTDVTVYSPPSTGRFTGVNGYVEVFVDRDTPTFFGTVLGYLSLRPGARAVAGTSSGPNCIVTLDQNGTPSLHIGGTVHMNMPGCNIQANGNMNVGNGVGTVTASAVGVQGTCTGCPSNTTTGMPPATDPLATLPVPTNPYPGPPTAFSLGNNQPPVTLNPGWYSSIIVGNSDTVTLSPGTYWISGPVSIKNSATLTGSGVFIYLAGTASSGPCTAAATAGCLDIWNSARVTLSAQTSGPYNGILFFQARTNALDVSFANTSVYTLSGAMYFPAADVTLGNAGGSNDCTIFVAHSIDLGQGGGNMDFNNTCSAYGGSPLLTVSLAE